MSDSQYWSDLSQIPTTIADDIIANSKALKGINGKYIARATAQITYESQTAGPDFITLTLNDPDWTIQTSGLCDVGPDGLLQPIDFNFPKGTDVWWRLAEVNNQGGTLDQAALQLVFYHRAVVYLMQDYGDPVKAAAGTTTQAQFIKQLCDRVPKSLDNSIIGPGTTASQAIQFICPELNIVQPIATTTTAPTTTQQKNAQPTKAAGNVYTVTASWYTGAGGGSCGNLQDGGFHYAELSSNTPSASGAGDDFSALGGLPCGTPLVIEGPNGAQVTATKADVGGGGPGVGDHHRCVDLYGADLAGKLGVEGPGIALVKIWRPDGQPIGGSAGPPTGSSGTEPQPSGAGNAPSHTSNVGQLERGGTDNPGESSWACIQRLASAQNWLAYTSVHNGEGQWGNYLTYITGPRQDDVMPSAIIKRSLTNQGTWDLEVPGKSLNATTKNALLQQPQYTVDNTAWITSTTVKRHGKVRQKQRIAIPSSPTQIQIQVISEPMTLNAGEVVYFQRAGALNGRWIITDNTRDILDPTSQNQLTLAPPTNPLPQPSVTTTSKTGTQASQAGGGTGPGTVGKVIEMAKFLSSKQLGYNQACVTQKYPTYETSGYDCAGGVAYILFNAGFKLPTGGGIGNYGPFSGDWTTWGAAGQGQQMTIWANSIHIFIEFHFNGGHQGWDSGHSWSASAPWYTDNFYDGNYVSVGENGNTFTPRHWPGL